MFFSWLAQSLAPASDAVYLASVRSLHLECGDQAGSTTAIPVFTAFLKVTTAQADTSRRLPITKEDLRLLHIQSSVVSSDIDATIF